MDVSTKTTGEATKHLAVCNLDWDRVTATDLFGKLYTLKRLLHVVCNNNIMRQNPLLLKYVGGSCSKSTLYCPVEFMCSKLLLLLLLLGFFYLNNILFPHLL